MKSSTKKMLAAMLSIALLLVIIIFLNSGRDSERDIVPQHSPRESNPLPPEEMAEAEHLEEPGKVFGIVEDEAGRPLREASVRAIHIVSDASQYDVAVVETLEDGKYMHGGLTLGNRYRLVASAPGYASSSSEEFLHEKEDSEINFALAKVDPVEIEGEAELQTIISGIKESARKFRSGRIVYSVVRTVSPSRYTDEEIENRLKKQEEIFRSDPKMKMSEKKIQYLLAQERKSMKNAQKQTEDSTLRYSGEYIFEGDNYYHLVEFPSWGSTVERYVYENKMTTFDNPGDKGPPPSISIRSGISDGRGELYSPLNNLLSLISRFTAKGWRISDIKKTGGGIAYTLCRNLHGWESEIDVFPEHNYYVSQYRSSRKPGSYYRHVSYAKMAWDPNLGACYPREIREERGPKRNIETIYLEEVEFNKDYDDNIFKPVFEEGTRISDQRFDPSRRFTFQYPDHADEYLAQLDEEAKRLEEEKEDIR